MAAASIPRERLRHLARRIHRLGERPLFELFAELDAGADLSELLELYARLPPAFIAAGSASPPHAAARSLRSRGDDA